MTHNQQKNIITLCKGGYIWKLCAERMVALFLTMIGERKKNTVTAQDPE